MTRSFGRAAFLAVVSVIGISVFGVHSSAAAQRPIVACFKPGNATLIGRLGPNDPSVRYAFEAGACLALRAGTPVSDVVREGDLWRFRTLGAAPVLYAPAWGAGFIGDAVADDRAERFAGFVPVSTRLLETGNGFAHCIEESQKLAVRWRDLNRRWAAYQAYGSVPARTSPKVVIYYGPRTAEFAAEAAALRQESDLLDRRCGAFEAVEADNDFLAFVRSAPRPA